MAKSAKSILIIEDDAALSDAFNMILKHAGYKVKVAYNGRLALDWLENHEPDLILLDILMPVMDGREFLMNYRNERGVPIVALSNLDARTDVEQIVKLGATTYTLKSSVTPEKLVEIVEESLDDSKR